MPFSPPEIPEAEYRTDPHSIDDKEEVCLGDYVTPAFEGKENCLSKSTDSID
jgi:hypothetical protein